MHHKPILMGYRMNPRPELMPEASWWNERGEEELPNICPDPHGTEYIIYIPNKLVWTDSRDVSASIFSPFESSSLDISP